MPASALAPPVVIADGDALRHLADRLAAHSHVAVDTESNSLHAYRERVCLLQFSTPDADFIVDPIALADLSPLAPFFANPDQQKIFHAAEYDLICLRRTYRFEVTNIFDTMIAARTLGWPQFGLAAILGLHFGITLNKTYQRADWKRRPLTREQLDYARLDTHYLPALRDKQLEELNAAGRWPEAAEEFARLAGVRDEPATTPDQSAGFWRVKGARDITPPQAAVLRALFVHRERQAERLDVPPFRVMAEATLMDLACRAPRRVEDLPAPGGMTTDQVRRFAGGVLAAIEEGIAAAPEYAPALERDPDEVRERYERLHAWRKERARARGVESDVILPRTALQDLARRPPATQDDLASIADFGPWRRETYGREILALLNRRAG